MGRSFVYRRTVRQHDRPDLEGRSKSRIGRRTWHEIFCVQWRDRWRKRAGERRDDGESSRRGRSPELSLHVLFLFQFDEMRRSVLGCRTSHELVCVRTSKKAEGDDDGLGKEGGRAHETLSTLTSSPRRETSFFCSRSALQTLRISAARISLPSRCRSWRNQ